MLSSEQLLGGRQQQTGEVRRSRRNPKSVVASAELSLELNGHLVPTRRTCVTES